MTPATTRGPVLFCYDGSEGSRRALRSAADLIDRPSEVVILTVWETIATRLALGGAFVSTAGSGDLDVQEESFARSVAEDGAERAKERGYNATALIRESFEGVAMAVLETADEISASLIVCGQRGRGPIRSALLGSVSHALASHARFPVLIAPETIAD